MFTWRKNIDLQFTSHTQTHIKSKFKIYWNKNRKHSMEIPIQTENKHWPMFDKITLKRNKQTEHNLQAIVDSFRSIFPHAFFVSIYLPILLYEQKKTNKKSVSFDVFGRHTQKSNICNDFIIRNFCDSCDFCFV